MSVGEGSNCDFPGWQAMPNRRNKLTKLSLNFMILRLVPKINMSSRKLWINIGPCMSWKILVFSNELRSKLERMHYIALFRNLLYAHGEAFHPKVSA